MAPRRFPTERIQEGEVDARSDIYSLALVLYEMLTGRLPFEAKSTFDLLLARVTDPPLPITAANPALPDIFGPILDKGLARDPDQRYQSWASRRKREVGLPVRKILPSVNGQPTAGAEPKLCSAC